jgi:hypothetical protein
MSYRRLRKNADKQDNPEEEVVMTEKARKQLENELND